MLISTHQGSAIYVHSRVVPWQGAATECQLHLPGMEFGTRHGAVCWSARDLAARGQSLHRTTQKPPAGPLSCTEAGRPWRRGRRPGAQAVSQGRTRPSRKAPRWYRGGGGRSAGDPFAVSERHTSGSVLQVPNRGTHIYRASPGRCEGLKHNDEPSNHGHQRQATSPSHRALTGGRKSLKAAPGFSAIGHEAILRLAFLLHN